MKSLSALHIKQVTRAAFLLLASFASLDSNASVTLTNTYTPPNLLISLLFPINGVACLVGEPCVTPDGSWTEGQLPTLEVGQQASISASSPSFSFYLGNSLNGKFGVSLTPIPQISAYNYSANELTANIFNRTSILSTTNAGISTFEASSGTDYYLLLSGLVRGGQSYQLQVSQVPLPAAFWLLGSVLSIFFAFKRRT
jgi:hypothetical protein